MSAIVNAIVDELELSRVLNSTPAPIGRYDHVTLN